ncbi:MAG: Fic family protein [Syntrophaceae bacterium]|nr:Fic family protein [Syntrophaceae bacterium]MBN2863270.1 Fic family protein [Bacteroidales bacterium]
MDPLITAAVLAFGFIYIRPFSDGNGRIHRYLAFPAVFLREDIDQGFFKIGFVGKGHLFSPFTISQWPAFVDPTRSKYPSFFNTSR